MTMGLGFIISLHGREEVPVVIEYFTETHLISYSENDRTDRVTTVGSPGGNTHWVYRAGVSHREEVSRPKQNNFYVVICDKMV